MSTDYKYCCEELKTADNLHVVWLSEEPPTITNCDYDGIGIDLSIKFCPFCGTELSTFLEYENWGPNSEYRRRVK